MTATPELVGSPYPGLVFSQGPLNVYWEATIACGLACKHCRAEAQPTRAPDELDTEAARALVRSVRELGSMLIVTGGDPLEREDLYDLIAYARSEHVPVAVTPAITPTITRAHLQKLADLGTAALGVSLDAPMAELHDGFRNVPGTFARTLEVLGWSREVGLPVQINTTITTETIPHLPALYSLLREQSPPVRRWLLFLLVPVGRGTALGVPTAREVEDTFGWIYDTSKEAPFHVGTVEAPHYRRYWFERKRSEGVPVEEITKSGRRMAMGMRDGNGIIFVSHTGEVMAAGFLPRPVVGNVRDTPLDVLYRTAPELLKLRNPDGFHGPCGTCDYRWICGGSRARALAASGDPFGSDPMCVLAVEQGVTDAGLGLKARA